MANTEKLCGCVPFRTASYIAGCFYLVEAAFYILLIVPFELFSALLFWIISIIVLFVGIQKNKPGNLKAFLVYDVMFSIMSLSYLAFYIPRPPLPDRESEILAANFVLLYACYRVFCWFVIRSHYVAMKQNVKDKEPVQATNV